MAQRISPFGRALAPISPLGCIRVNPMFTSSADVFRTRQSVSDLLEVVHQHRDAVNRLGATGSDRSEIAGIALNGCVIPSSQSRAYSAILHAAAMPDEDFNGFVVATAMLIADRLQHGGSEDDLYWNYDAFQDHYRLADPPARAALMNGFRTGHQQGLIHLPKVPDPDVCLTRMERDVVEILAADKADPLLEAVRSNVSAKVAGQLWRHAAARSVTWTLRAGFRYLYERPLSMTPEDPENAKLIPWS